MAPPLPTGMILQNRYQIGKVLGEGGFGRTYLAADKDRFEELCVLKEYNPNVQGTYALNKSKELFEREAKTLYKIDHPQIPKFRATFEQGKRLFLVQDYVEGQTYRALLDGRLAKNRKYTQRDIVQFLEQMLPVLEHIHKKGIVHRDISPDNIIYSKSTIEGQSKRLPVLIDFGAVKEIGATNLQSEGGVRGTTVGKLGYSPPEQLQTGEVSPSSDLYALAVTAVVLMTGRKPEELLNQQTMMPCWHQWVPDLHPRFAPILNKMMSYRPENRYQSANDALFDLRSHKQLILGPKERIATPKPNSTPLAPQKVTTPPQSPQHEPPRKNNSPSLLKTLWHNPWTGKIIGAGLVFLITAGVSWSIRPPVREVTGRPEREKIAALPEEADASPTVKTDAKAIAMDIRLNLSLGERKNEASIIQSDEIHRYRISGSPGKLLSIKLRKGRVAMTVLNSNEEAIVEKISTEWERTIPDDGVYIIDIHPLAGSENSKYELEIAVMEL
ncbi:MAG: serine/threonine protein kinase [Hormoscilla sp.]